MKTCEDIALLTEAEVEKKLSLLSGEEIDCIAVSSNFQGIRGYLILVKAFEGGDVLTLSILWHRHFYQDWFCWLSGKECQNFPSTVLFEVRV